MPACPLCDKKVSWPGLPKHFFGKQHLEEHVKPALLKADISARGSWFTCDGLPKIAVSDDKVVYMCFGCEKVKQAFPVDHRFKCKMRQHVFSLKALLGEAVVSNVAAPAETNDAAAPAETPETTANDEYTHRAPKKVVEQVVRPWAQVVGKPVDLSEREVIRIKVRKYVAADGRKFLLDYKKDKLYGLKGKYAGRLKDGVIVDYPDSD
jgi:hypothetical protein